jgi:hypothetical protein
MASSLEYGIHGRVSFTAAVTLFRFQKTLNSQSFPRATLVLRRQVPGCFTPVADAMGKTLFQMKSFSRGDHPICDSELKDITAASSQKDLNGVSPDIGVLSRVGPFFGWKGQVESNGR